MPINRDEIIEEVEGHMRKFGSEFGEWCVGTAKDSRGPYFRRHLSADLGDGLAYREDFTTNAAQAVVAHLVNDRGLELVPEAERGSALHPVTWPSMALLAKAQPPTSSVVRWEEFVAERLDSGC